MLGTFLPNFINFKKLFQKINQKMTSAIAVESVGLIWSRGFQLHFRRLRFLPVDQDFSSQTIQCKTLIPSHTLTSALSLITFYVVYNVCLIQERPSLPVVAMLGSNLAILSKSDLFNNSSWVWWWWSWWWSWCWWWWSWGWLVLIRQSGSNKSFSKTADQWKVNHYSFPSKFQSLVFSMQCQWMSLSKTSRVCEPEKEQKRTSANSDASLFMCKEFSPIFMCWLLFPGHRKPDGSWMGTQVAPRG